MQNPVMARFQENDPYAFDSISHVQLFDIMLELGFPEHIVALLHSLYIIPANRYGFPVSCTEFSYFYWLTGRGEFAYGFLH